MASKGKGTEPPDDGGAGGESEGDLLDMEAFREKMEKIRDARQNEDTTSPEAILENLIATTGLLKEATAIIITLSEVNSIYDEIVSLQTSYLEYLSPRDRVSLAQESLPLFLKALAALGKLASSCK